MLDLLNIKNMNLRLLNGNFPGHLHKMSHRGTHLVWNEAPAQALLQSEVL